VTITLIVMFTLEWRVTLIAISLLPLFIIPARIVGRRLQALSREGMGLNAEMNTVMTERFHVAGALLVKLFGRIDREVETFHNKAERVAAIGVKQAMTGRALFASLGLVGTLATAMVYLVGGWLVIDAGSAHPGRDRGGAGPVRDPALRSPGPAVERSRRPDDGARELRAGLRGGGPPAADRGRPDAVELEHPTGRVTFDHVWFRFPAASGSHLVSLEGPTAEHGDDASDWILRDIDLDIPPGAMIALVGRSGAGKSTLSSLVPRLHDVTEGAVRIDGHDVRDLTLTSVADAVGVVSQDPHLFHDSIAVNLRYARPEATDADLERVARAARIHETIAALPDGYDTIVGERGYRLSGGEKQRLSIARVLLKDPAIVVLDEATAHLDTESERLVQAALKETLEGRTSLVIAHRLSTVVDADEIIVLDAGRIAERGTHRELLVAGGLYAELARTQLVGVG
jgi:ATP-binding cassette, subfamily B, bacterial